MPSLLWRALAALAMLVLSTPAVGALPAPLDLHGNAAVGSRPVTGAVIWLDAPDAPPLRQSTPVVLDQRNLAFNPQVLAVRVGTIVDFPNHDRVFHNVFSFHDGKRFDLGMYPVGTEQRVTFDQPGLSRIFCNIHPNMAAYVMAVDTPFFAVSDENGAFAIPNVPAGPRTFHAWRAGADQLSGTWSGDSSLLTIKWP